MTRSQFFKRLGLGALVCAVAPKMLAEKPVTDVLLSDHEAVMQANRRIIEHAFKVPEGYLRDYLSFNYVQAYDHIGAGVHKFYIADATDLRLELDHKCETVISISER